jgi:hypothetical protein
LIFTAALLYLPLLGWKRIDIVSRVCYSSRSSYESRREIASARRFPPHTNDFFTNSTAI